MKQLISRNENMNRKVLPIKTASTGEGQIDEECATRKKRPYHKDSYGCVNWGPVLSEKEMEEQENIREELKNMHEVKEQDWDKVCEKMKAAYQLIRKDINDGATLKDLIIRWPYLVEESVLINHSEILLGLNVMETLETAYKQKAPILIRYFKTKPVHEDTLARLEVEKNNDNLQAILQGVILCIQKCLGETEESLMFSVDEMASNEEIESVNSESCPRLAMLGENSLAAREFALLVDNQVVGRYRSYLEAICLLFCAYYIFNIQYPEKGAATLEFIQRSFIGINPDKGIKVSKKRRSSTVNSKVLTLINQITDFEWIG